MVSIQSGLPVYDPGLLRHRIEIQEQAVTKTSFGSKDQIWAGVRRPWASIELLGQQGPKEFYQGGQISAESTHVMVIRWCPLNTNAAMRVSFRNQIFKVNSVDNVMQVNQWIQLFCVVIDEQSNPDPVVGP